MRSLYALVALAFTLPLATALPLPVEAPHAAAAHHVHMMTVGSVLFVYDPPVLSVAAGDTVVFHAHDLRHSATSGITLETEAAEGSAPSQLHLNSFDTGELINGASSSVAISEAGAYPYYCTVALHRMAAMHGLILAQ